MGSNRSATSLVSFLQEDLAISSPDVNMALRLQAQNSGPLPMILWQYGLVSIEQLDQIFDWLEHS
ncbi:DUF2949 domain-containing protein [Leptolyngbya sp. FACHB-261]|uniref:DUF2949 domain-containing protein n=1 Tax=Leptolyngbya sp. FACHB-261 TaxID=2692806 RepID=UPI00168A2A06|nr:DUF2949 domain-containing protein [Leptolyngbya sp. FACHB-261]MBD2101234.1 DUF2949 domain-containing protein [Leptolyngbya sp. FACHB-261]